MPNIDWSDPFGWTAPQGTFTPPVINAFNMGLDVAGHASFSAPFVGVDPAKLFGMGNSPLAPGDAPAVSGPLAIATGARTAASGATTGDYSGPGPSLPFIGEIGAWVQRGTIIVLGFIFVAVGLAMFRNPNTTVVQVVKGAAAKATP